MAITAGELAIILSARDEASKSINNVKGALEGASKTATQMGANLTNVGSKLSIGVTAPLVLLGKKSVEVAADFESQMNIMSLAIDQSQISMEQMRDVTLAVGSDTRLVGINASQTAEAITNFAKAGLDANEILGDYNSYMKDGTELTGALRAAVDLAAASELDLGQASDVVAIAMATFGIDASEATRIADSFVQTADASVTSVGELADALTNVGPTAAQFGWGIEDVNVALGLLSERGIRGSEAGTSLKSMMTNIMRTTPDVTGALKALNITLYDQEGVMRSLPDIIGQLSGALDLETERTFQVSKITGKQTEELQKLQEKYGTTQEKLQQYLDGTRGTTESEKQRAKSIAKLQEQLGLYEAEMAPLMELATQYTTVTAKMTEEQRNNYIQTLAGTYGMKAMGTLLAEGVVGWDEMTTAIGNAATTQESAAARTKGFNAAMESLGGVIETLQIKAFTPLINNTLVPLVKRITEVADSVLQLSPEMLSMGVMIAGAAAAAGPLLMVLGGVASALGVLLSPVGLVVAGVVALTAAFVASQGGIGNAIATLRNAFDTLKAALSAIFAGDLGLAIDEFFEGFSIQLPGLKAALGSVIQVFKDLLALWDYAWPWIQAIVRNVLNDVVPFIKNMMADAVEFVQEIVGKLLKWWDENFPLIWATVNKILGFISKLWKEVWPVLSTVLETAWEIMKTTVETFIGNILSIIRTVMLIINGNWKGAWEEVKKILSNTWDAIKTITGTAIEAFLKIFDGPIETMKGIGKRLIEGLGQGIEDAKEWLKEKARAVADWLPGWIKSRLGISSPSKVAAEEIGRPFVEGIAVGLDDALPDLESAMKSIANIMASLGTVGEGLSNTGIAKLSGLGLEGLRDWLLKDIIPVVRGIHAAFKQLPKLLPEEEISESLAIWNKRWQAIAGILDSVVKGVNLLIDKPKEMKGKGLIQVRDAILRNVIPVVRGIHAAFKELPLLLPEEQISESMAIWDKRWKAIAGIIDSVVKSVELLVNKPKEIKGKRLEDVRDAILRNIIPVVRGIHAAFKELPLLLPEEVISESLDIWDKRFKAISGVLDSVVKSVELLINKPSQMKGKRLEDVRDALLRNVVPIIRGIHAAMKTLPTLVPEETISASMEIWSKRMGAALGIIQSTINIAALDLKNYRAPDLVVIRKLAEDAQDVVEEVSGVASSMYTTAEEMAPKVAMLETISGMVGKVKSILTDTIDVAKGLSEMSWREVKQNQVDSFTRNLANIVNWLTDGESGITAIANLSGLTAYESAVQSLGRIITEVVEAVREVMTLPAVWDNRLLAISSGMAKFFTDIAAAVTTQGAGFVATWRGLATSALQAFVNGFSGVNMRDIWTNIVAGASATLNDGVFRQLGYRNATAYKAGWAAAGVPYPGGNSQTTNNSYTLNVQTTQPAVNVVSSFGMLEAMA